MPKKMYNFCPLCPGLPFRREEGLAFQLRPHAFPYQTEVLSHLAERKQFLYPAQFALLKRRPIEVIKIELRKRNVWRYFRKIRTFDMQIIFAIPPIFHFRRWLGEFFPLFQSYESSIALSINSLRKLKLFMHFPTVTIIIQTSMALETGGLLSCMFRNLKRLDFTFGTILTNHFGKRNFLLRFG